MLYDLYDTVYMINISKGVFIFPKNLMGVVSLGVLY